MAEYFKEIRKKIGHDKLLAPGTSCIILNDRDEVLLLLRSDTEEWGLIGGFMDLGETVMESLKREVEEETGLTIHDPQLFGIYSGPEYESKHPGGDETASVAMAFLVRRYSGEVKGSGESKRIEFFRLDQLPEPLDRNSASLLKELGEYREQKRVIPTIV
jgi:ADP-ribose pyrophosphatase YjhB (NUDIX family)